MQKNSYVCVVFCAAFRKSSAGSSKKLRIFFPFIHPEVTKSMAYALDYLGHILVLPGKSFAPTEPGPTIAYFSNVPEDAYTYPFYYPERIARDNLPPNIEIIENDEIIENPPDVLFITCTPVERDVLVHLWSRFKDNGKTKLAHFTGVDVSPYTTYITETVKNILVTDNTFHKWAKNINSTCNIVRWIPWINFDHYKYKGPSDCLEMGCYIIDFKKRIPNDFEMSMRFKNYYNRRCPRKPVNLTFNNDILQKDLPNVMHNTIATLHIKHVEGFGYSIIESLAMGRPVFLFREFAKYKRYEKWCIEGKTCFYVSSAEEFAKKLYRLVVDKAYRYHIQETAAKTIREIINNEEQAQILQTFLDNLQ
ncbi:MAG: hypothetical protein K940chlam8_01187 [Chlamydiae bacterium]|nr:hypothetical protein [Chlamydiota bacterium]